MESTLICISKHYIFSLGRIITYAWIWNSFIFIDKLVHNQFTNFLVIWRKFQDILYTSLVLIQQIRKNILLHSNPYLLVYAEQLVNIIIGKN